MNISTYVKMFMSGSLAGPLKANSVRWNGVAEATWAAAKAATSGYLSPNGQISVLAGYSNSSYYIRRQLITFDISLIMRQVVQAKIKIKKDNTATSSALVVYNCTNYGTLTDEDFDSIGSFFGFDTQIVSENGNEYWEVILNQDAINYISNQNNNSLRIIVIDYDNDYLNTLPTNPYISALLVDDCYLLLSY